MKKNLISESGYFYPRVLAGALLCAFGLACIFLALGDAQAQGRNASRPVIQGEYMGLAPVVKFDVSPRLDEMQLIPPGPGRIRPNEDRNIVPWSAKFAPEFDPVVQSSVGDGAIPGPIVSFDGPPNVSGVAPPDPNGDVGPNHVVVMSNLSFQIFNKTGTSLLGPAANNTLWAGFGGPCQTENAGDPVVLHDQISDRWVLSQFTSNGPTFFFCMAVSTTSDPTGSYFRYAISTGSNFPDYPKMGVWPDAYYVSTREFSSAGPFAGVGAYALNRAQAVAGTPGAQIISFLVPPGGMPYNVGDGLLPADMDGSTPPPAGAPNYFVGSMDNNGPYGAPQDALTLWKFTANFTTPGNSTFALANTIPVAAYNSILGLCGGTRACIPQPGTAFRIDHLGYRQRPLHRLAYRNFGTHESLVTNQSVSGGTGPNGEVSGIRWWELRSPNSSPVVHQQGTFSPGVTDGIHRWMGSIAMDGEGNMGLAYSSSNNTNPAVFPSVTYTGRFANSPPGTMPLGEGNVIVGTGSQTGGGNRWGDYTSLTVDPSDDSTFWAVNEYLPSTSASGWRLRIGSFRISTTPINIIGNGGSYIVNAGPNGVLDPGETVTIALAVQNIGGPGVICTGALTGTLQASGGVTSPSGPQNYGSVCSEGAPVFRNFTFTVDPALPCGANVTLSLNLADGATPYGPFTYSFTTGSLMSVALQNFDSVTAPALPAGWTPSASGSGSNPITVTNIVDTAPNAVFLSEQSTVGLSEVTSPMIAIPGASKLRFRLEHNTEPNFDGLVLEISINGGAFQDILAAGGSFDEGGYNSTLPTTFMNPLPSRMAWTGLSGGSAASPTYKTVTVSLPPAAANQNVQFKWRQGSDSSVVPGTNPGSRIDSLQLVQTICGGSAPVASSAVSRKTHGAAGAFDVNLPLVGVGGAVGIEPRVGPSHQVVVTFPNPVSLTSADVTTGSGTASFIVASNIVTVTLANVGDEQRFGITLKNVNDGSNLGSVVIPIGFLAGDTNGNGSVTSTDIAQTKAAAGTGTVNASTFRTDVNAGGTINATDVGIVKSNSGHTLP